MVKVQAWCDDQNVPSAAELRQAIATYQTLIANHTLARQHIIARRRGAADHVMVELDERLEANARTIAALGRAVEISQEHLKLVERDQASRAAPQLGSA
jgi:hypothetical protein